MDGSKIQFFIDNKCSSDTLNYAFAQIFEQFNKMNTITIVGLVISILGCICHTVLALACFGACGKGSEDHNASKDSYGTFKQEENEGLNYEI